MLLHAKILSRSVDVYKGKHFICLLRIKLPPHVPLPGTESGIKMYVVQQQLRGCLYIQNAKISVNRKGAKSIHENEAGTWRLQRWTLNFSLCCTTTVFRRERKKAEAVKASMVLVREANNVNANIILSLWTNSSNKATRNIFCLNLFLLANLLI